MRTQTDIKEINMIHPMIEQLYPELDLRQLEVVDHREGSLRVIAGPGAGKTLVMCVRGLNLLLLGEVQPEQLVLCTFGRPAAATLRQRFRSAARAAGYDGDLDRVRIATIHSICRRILDPAPTLLDKWQQLDLLATHFHRIFGPDQAALGRWLRRDGDWDLEQAAKHFDRIVEELIRPQDLMDSGIPFLAAVGRCYRRYEATLRDERLVDFAHLQAWAYDRLRDDRIADPIAASIRHLLVDEYQDTTHIQERILLRLARAHGNICVVGDDDQAIYRFRGASVRNLLEFREHFPDCRTVELITNYRSHPGIVATSNAFMSAGDWTNPDGGPPFRYPKTIMAHAPEAHGDFPAVIAVAGRDPADECRQLVELVRFLKRRGVITDYSQVALLLHSVGRRVSEPYLDAFIGAAIPVRCAPAGSSRAASEPGFPSGQVVVTTIHQAKGLEWPVVIVGSVDFDSPRVDPVGDALLPYCRRSAFEPPRRIAGFDHRRAHYVALTRPQHLLVLTASQEPQPRFHAIWDGLPRWAELTREEMERLGQQRFAPSSSAPSSSAPSSSASVNSAPEPAPTVRVYGPVDRVNVRLDPRLIHRFRSGT